jgi:hypothetical protein
MANPFGDNVADQEVSVGRERAADSGRGAGFLLRRKGGIQAAGRLGSCAGAEVRDPYCARDSAPGGEGESAHCRVELSCRGRSRQDSPCPWDEGNWGVKDNAAGQAYYDSMLKLYAGGAWTTSRWIASATILTGRRRSQQIAAAIRKTGRPIVLSLSPGPTQLEHAAEVGEYAQLWRISDDHWDGWTFTHKPGTGSFPLACATPSTGWPSGSRM